MRSRSQAPLPSLLAGALALAAVACEPTAGIGARGQALEPSPLPPNGPIDLLFVVDNSGSMAEEQQALAESIYREDCPIRDLSAVPAALLNPEPGVLEQLAEVCGISQILAAYDRDFRVGVITTDVNTCDNMFGAADPPFDPVHRPQRGCLQRVPSTGEKVIERADPDLIRKFRELVPSVGLRGSPAERGLDAVQFFLDRDTAPGCEEDRDLFIRDDAELLVIFLSDEEDCSSGAEPVAGLPGVSEVCGQNYDWYINNDADDCYENADRLAEVESYAQRLRALKGPGREGNVRVAVIGGASRGADGEYEASGCRVTATGAISGGCFGSHGLSNFTADPDVCSPATLQERGGLECCTADAATRYFAVAEAMNGAGTSICEDEHVRALVSFLNLTENDG